MTINFWVKYWRVFDSVKTILKILYAHRSLSQAGRQPWMLLDKERIRITLIFLAIYVMVQRNRLISGEQNHPVGIPLCSCFQAGKGQWKDYSF